LEQAKKKAEAMLTNGKNNLIVTPNPEMVMSALKDSELNHVINNVAALSIPDGAGLQWGSWLLGENLYHQTPGIELMNELLILANEKGLRLFLVGGKPGVAEKAAENIKLQFPKLVIAGVNDGFFTKFEESLVVQKIFDSKADLVFAGLGAGRQEKWLSNHLVELGARVAMGIGGSLDIWAGEKKRAPKWVQRIGKEWVYRLVLEPWRLRRQMAIPAFLMKAFQEKYSRIVNKNNKKV
jgi:N-acetylglucosaminyldiphosphoundecaprenol N-acetyl-beta-D-mannosaminyltransferase